VGVIGQGYVGLPLALVFQEAGFRVTGFDVDPAKVAAISRGESFIKHIGPARVAKAVQSGSTMRPRTSIAFRNATQS
jgi:UDP-N-acetyl-D-glucosamine dehydrogenase